VCEADAREGGSIVIHMRAPDGNVHPMGGIFHEIKPHDRIVFTSFVDLPDGRRVLEGYNTVTFEEQRGGTRVTVHARAEGYVDFAAQMLRGMEAGWSQSLDKLVGYGLRTVGASDAVDQEQIRAIFGDRTNALFGKNVDLAVKHFADDLVSYDLDPPLEHHSYATWSDCRDKLVRYAAAGAEAARRRGRRAGALDVVMRPPLRFARMYVLQLGFLDGAHGAALCALAAAQVFLKYAELWASPRRR